MTAMPAMTKPVSIIILLELGRASASNCEITFPTSKTADSASLAPSFKAPGIFDATLFIADPALLISPSTSFLTSETFLDTSCSIFDILLSTVFTACLASATILLPKLLTLFSALWKKPLIPFSFLGSGPT